MDIWIHIFFLTSALVGGEWSASRPGRLTRGKRAAGLPDRLWCPPNLLSNGYRCPTERILSFENCPDVETVSIVSGFQGDTLNMCGNYRAMISCIWRRTVLLLPGFIMRSTNSCGYPLSIRSCLMFWISLLKCFWSWHTTLDLRRFSYRSVKFAPQDCLRSSSLM
jgi:hypothetical protein